MVQRIPLRAVVGLISVAVAMIALFGASPLKALSSTLQRTGVKWYSTEKNSTVLPAASTIKTPVYFFSHGGVSSSQGSKQID